MSSDGTISKAMKSRSTESQTLSFVESVIGRHSTPSTTTTNSSGNFSEAPPTSTNSDQSSHIFCSWTLPSRPLVYISTVQLSDVNYTSKRDLTLITTGLKECVVHLSEVAQWNSNQEIMQLASAEHEQSQHYITPNQNTDHIYTTTIPQ